MPARKPSSDRRNQIVKSALNLAYEHGPENVSTGMIATMIGISQPAIYKHFRNKEDIWTAVGHVLAAKISRNIDTAKRAGLAPVPGVQSLVLSHIDLLRKNPAMPELMTRRTTTNSRTEFFNTMQKAMRVFQSALERAVIRAVDTGHFRQDLVISDAVLLILGLIQSLVLRMYILRDTAMLNNDGARLLDMLLSGFSPKGEIR